MRGAGMRRIRTGTKSEIPKVTHFRRLLGYARPYRWRILLALVAMLAYGLASGAIVYLVKPIFDQVLRDRSQLGLVALGLIGAYLVKGLGDYLSGYLMTQTGQRVVRDLRSVLFSHVIGQSAAFFARRSTGQLLSRVTHDVTLVQRAVSETVGDLLKESLALLFYASLLFYWDARLALVCMTGAPLVVYPLVRLGQRVRRMTRRSQEEQEHLSHVAAEAFAAHRIVKAFGAEAHEGRRFRAASDQLYRTAMKVTSAVLALPPLMELLGGLALAGALWYFSGRITSDQMSIGEFTAFLTALFMMYAPLKRLSRVNATLQQAMAAAGRIFELLDTHTEVQDRPGAAPIAPLRYAIEFRDVSFNYGDRDRRKVLDAVSFTVRAGEMVAIVGLSGAGKTTLANLIPRFYDVTGGAILIDGVDIRDATLRSLRTQIALVTQDTVLFDDTIAANIAYGVPDASSEAIERAARAAHAHEFIVALPTQYRAHIGERGQRLSGGQRQRLAIARALLKNSPILILDEATSSLDAESELLVQDALARLMQDRTSLVIAHRLSTVRRANAIIVLDRGMVREIGRHDDLVTRPNGIYARLYALQVFGGREARTVVGDRVRG
ncbi:MAG: ATP-binding cassette domain-containing protein [Luteitalea sp.]|nr:ATP-binding cassette domain-containing protein [Luteitalea sp.]